MVKKSSLALIVIGAIGALVWGWNTRNSMQISERIRNEPQYAQLSEDKKQLELRKNHEFRINEPYGGGSAAIALAYFLEAIAGGYLLTGKKIFYSEQN